MQIHELNGFNGNMGSGTFAVVDDGTDTGKVSIPSLLQQSTDAIAEVNARVDNIIAGGTAPSEAEITDARLGADGVTYPSLGDAIRKQIGPLDNDIDYISSFLGSPTDYRTTNLIDNNSLIQGKMLADDGSIADAPNNTWYVTDYIDIGYEHTLYLKIEDTTIILLYCYDENQNPLGNRITKTSDRLTSHSTYYDVNLYPGTRYVRANVRTAWLSRYMLTKYFYPSQYIAAGTYVEVAPQSIAAKTSLMYRTENGINRTQYYAPWSAQLVDGIFSLLDMPQNTVAYVNLSEIDPSQIAGLPWTSGAVFLEKIGRGNWSVYRMYRNQLPRQAIGYYNGASFVWFSSANHQNIKIGMLGDSVTEGRVGGTSTVTDKGIPYWVRYEIGLPVVNLGVGNMGWASHQYLAQNAYEYIQTLDLSDYSVLTFQFGLNDGDIPLGDYEDTDADSTIFGYIYRCLDYVYSQNSSVQVIMINPTVGSKPDSFPYYNPNAHHSAPDGWTFTEYFEQMRLFCEKYSIPYIDGYKGLNAWNRKTLIGDNVHPTLKGYEVLGRYIAGQIKACI